MRSGNNERNMADTDKMRSDQGGVLMIVDARELLEYLDTLDGESPDVVDQFDAGWSCAVRRITTWVREHQEEV